MRIIDLLDNVVYSKILFKIGDKKIHSSELARLLYKKQSGLYIQLKYLQKKGYLKIEDKQQDGRKLPDNKKLYYVNYKKIISEFLKLLIDYKNDLLNQDKTYNLKLNNLYEARSSLNFNIIHKLEDKNFLKDIENNKYLILFFKILFEKLGNIKEEISLKTIYTYIVNNVKFDYTNWFRGSQINLERFLKNVKNKEFFNINFEKLREAKGTEKEKLLEITTRNKEKYDKMENEISLRIGKYKNNDNDLKLLVDLSYIISICNIKPSINLSTLNSEEQVGWYILKEKLTEKEFKEFEDIYKNTTF